MKRNFVWLAIGFAALLVLKPEAAELNTMLIVAAVEALALAMSGAAAYAFSRLDFTRLEYSGVLGWVFLGVHICAGLSVLGVYIAQIP